MKDKRSIEEQVAELTEDQKNKVIKAGFWATIAYIVGFLPLLIIFILATLGMFIFPSFATSIPYIVAWAVLGLLTFATLIAWFVILKVVCPYYSDRKYAYIKKNMKKN